MRNMFLLIFLTFFSLNAANLKSQQCQKLSSDNVVDTVNIYVNNNKISIEDDSLGAKIINVYLMPNPVHDYLSIYINYFTGQDLEVKIKNIEIIDCAGITRKLIENYTNQSQIDVRDLAPGVYFCKITTYLETALRKFVKI